MSKLGIKMLAIIAVIVLVAGCNGSPQLRSQDSKDEKNNVKVAIISATNYNDNFNIFKKSLEEHGKKVGLELLWMDGEGNILKQEDAIEEAAKQDVKVVVIEPVELDMIGNTIKKMQNKGIKFICLNTLPSDTGIEAYITPDFERAGEMQAQQLIKEIKDNQPVNILIIHGQKDDPIAEGIISGSYKILQGNPIVKELWVEEIPSRDTAKAYETVKEYLASPNPPAAVITHFSEHTEGMLKAVNELPSEERTQIITFGMGTQKAAIEAIGKGSHTGEIDFMPDLFAQLVVKAVNSLSKNELWEYETQVENGAYNVQARFSPIRLITKENVQLLTERMKELEKSDTKSNPNEQNKGGNSGENDEKSQSNEAKQEDSKKKSIIIIKTKDGQEFQMDISGEIESVEMKSGEKEGSEGQ
ncbi:MAG: hypothetical protein CVU87_02325 [Firmicutes bacterium HGW-Firmicutes-12]|nr:MAG: hypothetical protein CVU87_02325 [Firmicutes bacterium HGW-Firmicutes-12]